ncbi:class I SAM-dependent methyltransferase [Wenxinia marina]|uniref:Dimethyladenosine transferase (rRNA methylation) n=1 Tax=Wenxinia marina DSM 24838 TaxID=1123501 RepID=A0A0D0Q109_9RHOB|nr:class I SAM-dependent methyltransferase [Wenxinia marina]KIQ68209.1 Dimethyladenosine transferase (rRNA methylation) [Wenxinia marina DSM 24838]GGL76766.1 methyltransferase [Wenxinia marina]
MDFEPDTFGRLYAGSYDDGPMPPTLDASVDLISDLAGPEARILELAIGTGRVALPLAAKGHRIEGIEGSADMAARLAAKPGGDAIPVTIGDMADVDRDGPFTCVFLVFNTIFNLTSQEAQVRLFANVADRLAPGGTFLVETFVPSFDGFTENQRMKVRGVAMDSLFFEAVEHDPVAQRLHFQRARIEGGAVRLSPLVMRYARPPELDLMARMAGLRLRDRWGGWAREPFTAASAMHVSVWEKPS